MDAAYESLVLQIAALEGKLQKEKHLNWRIEINVELKKSRKEFESLGI